MLSAGFGTRQVFPPAASCLEKRRHTSASDWVHGAAWCTSKNGLLPASHPLAWAALLFGLPQDDVVRVVHTQVQELPGFMADGTWGKQTGRVVTQLVPTLPGAAANKRATVFVLDSFWAHLSH